MNNVNTRSQCKQNLKHERSCKRFNLAIFSEKFRPSVYCLPEYRDFAFITTKGTMMESSQVTDQFNSLWNRAVGQTETRKRVNGALVKKSTVTRVHATHSEMKSELAT